MTVVSVPVRRLRPSTAGLPQYATPGAAGMDLHAALDGPTWIQPGERISVPTGIALALPVGFEGQVRPRSGMAHRGGVTIANAPGTIDSDFRGEVQVLLINLGAEAVRIDPGDRVAQLVVAPVVRVVWQEVDELSTSSRGTGGLGSTGVAGSAGRRSES